MFRIIYLAFHSFQLLVAVSENSTLYSPKWNEFLINQAELLDGLFDGYDATVSPIYTNIRLSGPLENDPLAPKRWNYTVFLYSFKLIEVVEPQEKVTVVVEVAEHWHDPRLVWEPQDFGNISSVHLRQDKVWSPTLTAYGVSDIIDFRDQDFRMVGLQNIGELITSVAALLSTNCPMKVTRFPFDSQTCQIKFCLPIFYAREVQILNEVYTGILNKSAWGIMGNSEWDLINFTSRIEMLSYNDDFGNLELAVFEFKLRRNPMYYIYMIIFPSFIINIVSIIGVFIKNTDTMSKLNVGLTNIMTMTFILGVMADKIPKTGSIPLLGIYIIINLFIMIVAVGVTIGIIEFRKFAIPRLKRSKNKHQHLIIFVGDPLESLFGVILGLLTTANFVLMIIFWITDA